MREPVLPDDELPRLAALHETGLLDSAPEARFDRLTRLAKHFFDVPITLVSLVDSHRQWFKSRQGLDACETGRDISFCGHAILAPDVFVVPDASKDERFFDNPLVTGPPDIRFYAGAPLTTAAGFRIGTLCIIDRRPRAFDATQAKVLREFADCIEEEINQIRQDMQRRSLAALVRITGSTDPDPKQTLLRALAEGCRLLGLPIGAVTRVTPNGSEIVVAVSPSGEIEEGTAYRKDETPGDLAMPLLLDGVNFGAIVFAATDRHTSFDLADPEIEFLRLLASWVAKTLRQWHTDEARIFAQDKLRQAHELLERTHEAARIGTWEVDLASDMLQWSPVTREIHEVAPDFQASMTSALAFFPEGRSRNAIIQAYQAAITRGDPYDIEVDIVTARGNERWVRAIGLPVLQEGHCLRIHGLLQDISERKRLDQMKSEFIATVSHELRTPLTSINGALALIGSGSLGELPAKASALVKVAQRNGARLSHLINDLLDMEKLLAGKMQFDLQAQLLMPLVDSAVESNQGYAASRQVKLAVIARDDSASVVVDALRLQQVLANLLSNAAKYSPASEQVEIRVVSKDGLVRIDVIDHGPGIPNAFRGRIFEKFSQADATDGRSRGGTGLGLAISKQLVEQMNGRIGFDSVEGHGSTFYVEFPRLT